MPRDTLMPYPQEELSKDVAGSQSWNPQPFAALNGTAKSGSGRGACTQSSRQSPAPWAEAVHLATYSHLVQREDSSSRGEQSGYQYLQLSRLEGLQILLVRVHRVLLATREVAWLTD